MSFGLGLWSQRLGGDVPYVPLALFGLGSDPLLLLPPKRFLFSPVCVPVPGLSGRDDDRKEMGERRTGGSSSGTLETQVLRNPGSRCYSLAETTTPDGRGSSGIGTVRGTTTSGRTDSLPGGPCRGGGPFSRAQDTGRRPDSSPVPVSQRVPVGRRSAGPDRPSMTTTTPVTEVSASHRDSSSSRTVGGPPDARPRHGATGTSPGLSGAGRSQPP